MNTAELVRLLRGRRWVALTGAGISTDSGIPDYRGQGSPPRTPMNIAQFMGDVQYRRRFWAGASVGRRPDQRSAIAYAASFFATGAFLRRATFGKPPRP